MYTLNMFLKNIRNYSCLIPNKVCKRLFSLTFIKQVNTCVTNWELSKKYLLLNFSDHEEHKYHYLWLRDHCRCSKCYSNTTHARIQQTHKIPANIYPLHVSLNNGCLRIEWSDNHISIYSESWLFQNHYNKSLEPFLISDIKCHYWGKEIQTNVPESIHFENVCKEKEDLLKLLENVAIYGFAIVKNTPTTLESVRTISNLIGYPRKTFYGDVWLTTNRSEEDMDHADLAYSNVALPCHTDGTYFLDSPGLQMFHCHEHTGTGGETVLVDGIGAAEKLKLTNPDAVEYLAKTWIPATYYEKDRCSKALGPIIKINPYSKEIYQVRINDGDRDVLNCLSFDEIEKFYNHYIAFLDIIYSKEQEFRLKLTPGNLLIVNNWRVLHGRTSFTGKRSLSGCYINMDDYLSTIRVLREHLRGIPSK
ncbi:trimethyllysine dioxygenase, mitochondrial isoform X1 [Hydra vulgaris]|uniref:trimethyllysine dioxygenase, mitochondrial isoform X1 n=1 Tax=Hydra vulgaris TaxID=6087 RepID=UPI001F5EA60A|nr:trimethyllysine dioxygenase, mitochondrial-like isoform X2 [Hydra vulgaris]